MMRKEFLDLRLDGDGLHTPVGLMALADISAADFARNTETVAATPGSLTTSTAGVVGGAVVGGVVAGPVGAVAGGLAGSTIKTDSPGESSYDKTVSATIVFRTGDLEYTTVVSVFDVENAEEFVGKVRDAAGLPARS
jgi:outer membrane lipoprotein SlyB